MRHNLQMLEYGGHTWRTYHKRCPQEGNCQNGIMGADLFKRVGIFPSYTGREATSTPQIYIRENSDQ